MPTWNSPPYGPNACGGFAACQSASYPGLRSPGHGGLATVRSLGRHEQTRKRAASYRSQRRGELPRTFGGIAARLRVRGLEGWPARRVYSASASEPMAGAQGWAHRGGCVRAMRPGGRSGLTFSRVGSKSVLNPDTAACRTASMTWLSRHAVRCTAMAMGLVGAPSDSTPREELSSDSVDCLRSQAACDHDYGALRRRVEAALRSRGVPTALRQDAVQEALLATIRQRDRLGARPDDDMARYAIRVAFGAVANEHRARRQLFASSGDRVCVCAGGG